MKVCIAYDSKYGNGKQCMEHLKQTLSKRGHDVQLFSIRETKPRSLPAANLYLFSAPTHVGGPPRKMKKFLKKLEINKEGAKYSLITTYMNPNNKTLEKMDAIIKLHGMAKGAEGIKIKVMKMKGPLEDDYKNKLDAFANELIK